MMNRVVNTTQLAKAAANTESRLIRLLVSVIVTALVTHTYIALYINVQPKYMTFFVHFMQVLKVNDYRN